MRLNGSILVLWVAVLVAGCAGTHNSAQQASGSPEARAASEDNPSARLHTELGAGYYARGQYAVALQELRKALASDSAYAPAYSILGLVHAELGEDKQAEASFQRAVELSPG